MSGSPSFHFRKVSLNDPGGVNGQASFLHTLTKTHISFTRAQITHRPLDMCDTPVSQLKQMTSSSERTTSIIGPHPGRPRRHFLIIQYYHREALLIQARNL